MLKNYLKTAFRFLKRNKLFAAINILGLSLALAASFIILLYVINELSYDKFYKDRNQIFRVVTHLVDQKTTTSGTPYVMASTLKDEFPQVEYAANMITIPFKLKLKDEFIKVYTMGTSSEVFDIFQFPLKGSPKNILDDMNSIVLSQKQAEKFFPGEDPIGKEILGLINNEEHTFIVKGVFDDIPINSTIKGECFVNGKWYVKNMEKMYNMANLDMNWYFSFWNTWIKLKKGTKASGLESQFTALEEKVFGDKTPFEYSTQNLSDIYLHSDDIANTYFTGSLKNIKTFSGIALLIVLVAAINYIILSTAVSTGRTKEIGVRKTSGASSRLIGNQLLNEAVLLALTALPFAAFSAWTALPYAAELFQFKLRIIPSNIVVYLLVYVALTLFIGVVSGLYTSSYLSKLKVVNVFKNNVYSGQKKPTLRYSLVVIQLIIFCSFISSVLIIRSQYQYALNKDLGYQQENIIAFSHGKNFKGYSSFLNAVRSFPEVEMAAGTMSPIPTINTTTIAHQHFQENTKKIKVEELTVDYGFLGTMGIQLLDGRDFSTEFGSDLNNAVIINETAVKQLGINEPIGKKLGPLTIIGVVKDFNFHSVHSSVPPLQIRMSDRHIGQTVVRYKEGSLGLLIPKLEDLWKKEIPGRPFEYRTIEEMTQKLYTSEKNLGVIVSVFGLFALLISTLGLFGLTLFIAKTQTKQIGIKKVLGCRAGTIINTFLRENFILVGIAAFLSMPITLYFMSRWLNNFSYKTNIHWWIFALAFIFASVVVLATVFIQSARTSRVNPVEALRYE